MPLDVDEVLASISELASGAIAADAEALDRTRSFPDTAVEALGRVGALGLVVSKDAGGAGGGLSALAAACEMIGGACASTGMVFLMHSVTAGTIGAGGGPRARGVLEQMAAGRMLGSLAFSERGTGAHFYAPELQAERDGDRISVSGRKSFVTSGGHADVYLILLHGAEAGTADTYLLDGDQAGVSFDGKWQGLGLAGNSSVGLKLDAVEVSEDSLIGGAGGGLDLVFSAVAPLFLVGLAAVNVGIASAAATAATAHAASRTYQDGSSLAEVQFIQHLLADMDASVRQARLLLQEAARLGELRDAAALVAIMQAKVVATNAAATVTQLALEATGGQGYTPALPVERHLRDARAGAVMAPTNAVLRSWIGKALTGLPVP